MRTFLQIDDSFEFINLFSGVATSRDSKAGVEGAPFLLA